MEPVNNSVFSKFKWPIILATILIALITLVLFLINLTETGHKNFIEHGFFNKYTLITFLVFALIVIILFSYFFIKNAQLTTNNEIESSAKVNDKQKNIVITGMKRVSKTLRNARGLFLNDFSYKYKLPWYLVCGQAQSGKSAFLEASGLRIPKKDVLDRNIDLDSNTRILISDRAVFIDAAGPFSHPDQLTTWQTLISRLKRFRPTQPINGIILTIDVAKLQLGNQESINALSLEIRDRLHQLQNELEVTPPIYLVLTKINQLPGFKSFFKGSPPTPTDQVFGLTLPLPKEDVRFNDHFMLNQFNKEFDDLIHWQLPRMLERTNQELMPKVRYETFIFLTELMKLKSKISFLIDKAFGPSELDDTFLLRGMYFVNSSPNSDNIGVNNYSEKNDLISIQGLFIKNLLEKVVLMEPGLVGFNEKARKSLARIRALLIGASVTILVGLLTWQIISFYNNNKLVSNLILGVDNAKKQLITYSKKSDAPNLGWPIPVLEALQDLPAGWNDTTLKIPLSETAGLSQRNLLSRAAVEIYITSLQKLLLPRLFDNLENNLSKKNLDPSFLYENLMVYLMFAGNHVIDKKTSLHVFLHIFDQQYPGVEYGMLRTQFSHHVQNLLDVPFEKMPKDYELIATARETLKPFSPASRGIALLKELPEITEIPYWRLQDSVGPLGSVALQRRSGQTLYTTIPGLFTAQALNTIVVPSIIRVADTIAKEDWVLFNAGEKGVTSKRKEVLKSEIISLYVNEYIQIWKGLLDDITFNSFSNFKEEITILQALVGPPSPIESLLSAITKETSFNSEQNKNAQETSNLIIDKNNLTEKTAKDFINSQFSYVRSFVAGTTSPLSEVLKNFSQIRMIIGPIAAANSVVSQETGKVITNTPLEVNLNQLQNLVIKSPRSIEDAVNSLIRQTTVLLETIAKGDAETDWKEGIYKFCNRSINNHFPFANSKSEVTLNDFNRMFSPDGAIDQFFAKYLKNYVDTSTSPWSLLVNTDSKLEISPIALHYFEQASWIKKIFFPGGSKEPRISFGLMPTDLDIKAKGIVIDVGGQSLSYQYGAQQMMTMLWPNGNNNVRVNFASTEPNQTKSLVIDGPWAIFRLLQSQKLQKISQTQYSLEIDFSGRYSTFLLEATTVDNPFQKDILRGFKCLPSIFQY